MPRYADSLQLLPLAALAAAVHDTLQYPSIFHHAAPYTAESLPLSHQVLFNKNTEQILGVHIIGLHAADLIQECSNAMAAGSTVRQLAMMVRCPPARPVC